jgi:ribonucleotide monophosphatase NagD (HAD superfamily)
VVGEQGLKDELTKAGISVVNCPKTNSDYVHTHEPSITIEEFQTLEVDQEVSAVVAGVNYDFTYRTLCVASLYL